MRRHHVVLVAAGFALCAWCGWISGFHRTSAAAEITWVVSFGAVIAVDVSLWRGRRGGRVGWRLTPVSDPWPRPGRGGGRRALPGVAPWLVLILVALAWDVLGIDTGPHQYHLTISALAQAYRPLNAALLLTWMLAGIGYGAARARAPMGVPSRDTGPTTPDPAQPGWGTALSAAMFTFGGHPGPTALLLPQSPPVGVAFWVAVPIAGLLLDVAARRSAGRLANAEEFLRFISTARAAQVALIAAWGFAGYHLYAR